MRLGSATLHLPNLTSLALLGCTSLSSLDLRCPQLRSLSLNLLAGLAPANALASPRYDVMDMPAQRETALLRQARRCCVTITASSHRALLSQQLLPKGE